MSWPPWGDRQSELFYDIYSTHADLIGRDVMTDVIRAVIAKSITGV